MNKHTPGPWMVWNDDDDPRHVYVGPKTGGLCVADVVACNAHGIYTAESEARGMVNARLIAAAPELLNALDALMRRAAQDSERYAPEGNEPIWAFIADASDAIGKATGGNNELR